MKNKSLLYLVCLFFSASVLFGQSISFKIKKSAEVKFADTFTVEIDATYPKDYTLEIDKQSLNLDDFKITNIESSVLVEGDTIGQKFTLKVVPFALGKVDFPSLNWFVNEADSDDKKQVKSPGFSIEVKEIDKPKDLEGEIYDIYGLFKPINYILIGIIILLAMALSVAVYFFIKRKRGGIYLEKIADNRPADVIAFEAIKTLLTSTLWRQGKIKLFYINLSDILRFYIEKRFAVSAHKLTSLELCRKLNKTFGDKIILADIRKFFNSCDLVKFAKYKPNETQRDLDVGNLKNIVTKTKPEQVVNVK